MVANCLARTSAGTTCIGGILGKSTGNYFCRFPFLSIPWDPLNLRLPNSYSQVEYSGERSEKAPGHQSPLDHQPLSPVHHRWRHGETKYSGSRLSRCRNGPWQLGLSRLDPIPDIWSKVAFLSSCLPFLKKSQCEFSLCPKKSFLWHHYLMFHWKSHESFTTWPRTWRLKTYSIWNWILRNTRSLVQYMTRPAILILKEGIMFHSILTVQLCYMLTLRRPIWHTCPYLREGSMKLLRSFLQVLGEADISWMYRWRSRCAQRLIETNDSSDAKWEPFQTGKRFGLGRKKEKTNMQHAYSEYIPCRIIMKQCQGSVIYHSLESQKHPTECRTNVVGIMSL